MKILVYTISVFVLFLLISTVTEYALRYMQLKALKKNQTFAKVNGHLLQYCKKGRGDFTVVFESGLGSDLTIWKDVQDSVSKNAVTLSYNRAGIGLSESSGDKPTNESVANDLIELLNKTNCPQPYIVVGHSMGGIYLRKFIKIHQDKILGIVFVDSAHPLQMKLASERLVKSMSAPPAWLIKYLMNTGLYRLIFSFTSFPPEVPTAHPINVQQKRFFYLSLDEAMKEVANDKINFEDAERYNSFGNIPLSIITGTSIIRTKGISDSTIRNEYQALVVKLQKDFLKLSSDSRLVEATKSGHVIQASEPDIIVLEIRKILLNAGHKKRCRKYL